MSEKASWCKPLLVSIKKRLDREIKALFNIYFRLANSNKCIYAITSKAFTSSNVPLIKSSCVFKMASVVGGRFGLFSML